MPPVPSAHIIQAVIAAFAESDTTAIYIPTDRNNPKRFFVQSGSESTDAWLYIWTLTHGGGAARPHLEYRVQITGVASPLTINPTGSTLLLGFEPTTGCFAGFDVSKHCIFSSKSPSIQIPITTLHAALQHGLSFSRKGNDEIAIGIRPDHLLIYLRSSLVLHAQGAEAQVTEVLQKSIEDDAISLPQLATLPVERQRIVSTISKLSRDAKFRRRVTNAYERRCAVTRIQLDLLDAAHLLPVGVDGSSDDVRNGICLSPTYHRAYDRSLIYLDESYTMRLNEKKLEELKRQGVAGGVELFSSHLDQRIHLPPDKSQWPDRSLIQQANKIRGITSN